MADAAEGSIVDPLDVNVNDVDTSYPVIPAKVYDLSIKKVEKKAQKEKAGSLPGENLVFQFATKEDLTDTKGNPVPAGFVISHYVGITPKPEHGEAKARTVEAIRKDVSAIAQSAGLNATVRSLIDNPAQFQGQSIRASVGINKATDDFPESNKIKSFEVVK